VSIEQSTLARLIARFMLAVLRCLIVMGNQAFQKGLVREILDLQKDLKEAAYPNGTYPEAYK